jgi:hypothetical protein
MDLSVIVGVKRWMKLAQSSIHWRDLVLVVLNHLLLPPVGFSYNQASCHQCLREDKYNSSCFKVLVHI